MTLRAYTANFGTAKGGLDTVEFAFLNSAKEPIGDWADTGVSEIIADSGIYGVYAEAAAGAYWLAWRTGEEVAERFMAVSLIRNAFVFNFWPPNSGKSVAYQFLDSTGAAIGDEITENISELADGMGIYLAIYTNVPTSAVYVKARTTDDVANAVFSLDPLTESEPPTAGYADELDENLAKSVLAYFTSHANGDRGSTLFGLKMVEEERDLTVFQYKPNLFIHIPGRKPEPWTLGRGIIEDEEDAEVLTVNTIAVERWKIEFQFDLGVSERVNRETWARKLDVVFRTAWLAGGIPVMDYANEGDNPTTQVGTIQYNYPKAVVHNNIDYDAGARLFQDSIVLTFLYLHKYVQAQADLITEHEVYIEIQN